MSALRTTFVFLIYVLVWKKEKLHWNFYTNFISEDLKIDFWQIWHFDVKGAEWVGLELGILTLAKLKYFVSRDLRTKTL